MITCSASIASTDSGYGCPQVSPAQPGRSQHSAVLVSLTDITAQRTASERLAYEATHDSLTGLPNRAYVVTRVTEALESGGHHVLAAVLFIDLDNLKTINDSSATTPAMTSTERGATSPPRRPIRRRGRPAWRRRIRRSAHRPVARPDLDALAQAPRDPVGTGSHRGRDSPHRGQHRNRCGRKQRRSARRRGRSCATPIPRCTRPKSQAGAKATTSPSSCETESDYTPTNKGIRLTGALRAWQG